MKNEDTNEFDPIRFDAEFARVFDEKIAAQTPNRYSYLVDADRQKLHSEKARLVSDLAEADLKIRLLSIACLIACAAAIIGGVLVLTGQ